MPLLHDLSPGLADTLPFVRLGTGPSPVREVPGLSGDVPVWLKDEGAYGDGGWGGNKVRKLEWLIPDAHRRGRSTLFTVGGIGTHWGLAAALYGREHGLRTALALVDQPVDDHVRDQLARLRGSGAALHLTHTKARTIALAPYLLARHSSGLRPPYYLPAGGSSPLGALGYVEVALELAAQVAAGDLPEPAWVVTAVGSGGTAAGLVLGLGLAGLHTRVLAVVVNDQLRLDAPALTGLATRSAAVLRERGGPDAVVDPDRLRVTTDFLGATYGATTPASAEAQARGETLGLTLEPVYTAKALAALLALGRAAELEGPVLFLGTHGPR